MLYHFYVYTISYCNQLEIWKVKKFRSGGEKGKKMDEKLY